MNGNDLLIPNCFCLVVHISSFYISSLGRMAGFFSEPSASTHLPSSTWPSLEVFSLIPPLSPDPRLNVGKRDEAREQIHINYQNHVLGQAAHLYALKIYTTRSNGLRKVLVYSWACFLICTLDIKQSMSKYLSVLIRCSTSATHFCLLPK